MKYVFHSGHFRSSNLVQVEFGVSNLIIFCSLWNHNRTLWWMLQSAVHMWFYSFANFVFGFYCLFSLVTEFLNPCKRFKKFRFRQKLSTCLLSENVCHRKLLENFWNVLSQRGFFLDKVGEFYFYFHLHSCSFIQD